MEELQSSSQWKLGIWQSRVLKSDAGGLVTSHGCQSSWGTGMYLSRHGVQELPNPKPREVIKPRTKDYGFRYFNMFGCESEEICVGVSFLGGC